jgi:translation initiation factor 3 subunit B
LGSSGPGVTIKTDVSFYQLDHSKNDFRLLRESSIILSFLSVDAETRPVALQVRLRVARPTPSSGPRVDATSCSRRSARRPSKSELDDLVKKDLPKEEWDSWIQQLGTADHYGVTDVEWDLSLATPAGA